MILRALIASACFAGLVSAATLPDLAMRGNREGVRSMLKQKAGVNEAQGDGMTALHWAAYTGDVEMARLLLANGANVKAVTRLEALTPLDIAAKNGYGPVVQVLLDAGSDANAATANGTTPLMLAAASGNVESVKALLDHGADANAKESAYGQTPLMFAAARNRGAVIKLLIARGASSAAASKLVKLEKTRLDFDFTMPPPDEPSQPPANGKTPAETTGGGRGGNGGGGRAGAPRREFGASTMGGMTALLYAARDGKMDAVKSLVESGADINQVNGSEHISPMVMAIVNGHYDLAYYLLDHGADPNLATAQGLTPLYATLDVEWSPHAWYPEPVTAQEKTGYLDLMKALLAHGANPNARLEKKAWYRTTSHDATWIDPAGTTAFWRAAQASDIAAMKLLVASGADPKIASHDGDTPLMVAAGLGWGWNFSVNAPGSWLGAVRYCLDLGYDLNTADSKGYTALHGAAYVGDNDLVKLLVDKGADVHAVSKDKNTVADMANGPNRFGIPHPETVALLEQLGSANSNNCRSDQCLVAPTPDKKPAPK